jgi:hypothetical protein
MIREEEFLERLRSTDDPAESLAIIREYDDLIQQRTP